MKILYVDDENLAIENFKYVLKDIEGIKKLQCCNNPMDAIDYVCTNRFDVAFLDIEMPVMRGIELGKRLLDIQEDLEIVYVTGYEDYAMRAFQVGAIGYVLKPYEAEDIIKILKKLKKISNYNSQPVGEVSTNIKTEKKEVVVRTFGAFDLFKNGELIPIKNAKAKEVLALLVNQKGGSMTSSMISSYLWEDREYDAVTKSYVWRAVKELEKILKEYNIEYILKNLNNLKAIIPDSFTCDYYEIMNGNMEYYELYNGYYMSQYAWAEETIPMIDNKVRLLTKKI